MSPKKYDREGNSDGGDVGALTTKVLKGDRSGLRLTANAVPQRTRGGVLRKNENINSVGLKERNSTTLIKHPGPS